MSRTYKDRPYRVKVNEDGVHRTASHNHDRFGEEIVKTHVVKDAKGQIIYDEVPVLKKVKYAIHTVPKFIQVTHENVKLSADSNLRYIDTLQPYVEQRLNPLYQRVFDLYNEGKLDEEVQVGTRKVARRVTSKRFAVKDHCTVNEAWDGHWHGENPCHKNLPDGYPQPRGRDRWRDAAKRNDNHRRRARQREATHSFTANVNAGFDPDENERAIAHLSDGEKQSGWW